MFCVIRCWSCCAASTVNVLVSCIAFSRYIKAKKRRLCEINIFKTLMLKKKITTIQKH